MKNNMPTILVLVIFAVSVIGIIGNINYENTNTVSATNESLTLVNNQSTTDNDDWVSLSEIRNDTTGNIITGECNTTYLTGIVKCNSSVTSTVYIDYVFYPNGYIKAQAPRVLVAVVLIVLIIGFLLHIHRKSGAK